MEKLEYRCFGLEGEKMKVLQHVERSSRVGRLWSCRVPAHTKKLSHRMLGELTVTIIQPNFMNTVDVDDDEIIASGCLWVGAWFADTMAQLDAKPDSLQGSGLEKNTVPLLKSSNRSISIG